MVVTALDHTNNRPQEDLQMGGKFTKRKDHKRRKQHIQHLHAQQQAIDAQANIKKNLEENVVKVLLLGAGESGKSTIFKQMNRLYGKGFNVDRNLLLTTTKKMLVELIAELIERGQELQESKITENTILEDEYSKEKDIILHCVQNGEFEDPSIPDAISTICASPSMTELLQHRSLLQVPDSFDYFLNIISDLFHPDYVLTDDDILRVRVRTTGLARQQFDVDGLKMLVLDVGGQRNERQKWMHFFEDVTSVIFVAALSGFDLLCFEDEETNRMEESINLWEEVLAYKWFNSSTFMLFLNKYDLFQEKIEKGVSIRHYFEDYDGPDEVEASLEYVKHAFLSKNHLECDVFVHVTCATDTQIMHNVMKAVQHTIVKQTLNMGGVL